MSGSDGFFRSLALTDLTLRVGDLPAVAAFYGDRLGFQQIAAAPDRVTFSASGSEPALLVLEAASHAPHRPAATAGLFHAAYLVPDRAALGRIARELVARQIPFGRADHGVSEALYLEDPERNGIEIYADRPVDAWPPSRQPGQVAMFTAALDLESLFAAADDSSGPVLPAATRLGHIHLNVSQLEPARSFYSTVLGFPIRQQDHPGALFFGRDGYHHHLAVNTWRSQRPVAFGARGLVRFTLRLADTKERDFVLERARATGTLHVGNADGAIVRDPDGVEVQIAAP